MTEKRGPAETEGTSMSPSRVLSPMSMPEYVSSWGPTNRIPRGCSSPKACVVVRPSAANAQGFHEAMRHIHRPLNLFC